jgi:hypothetical protein
MCCFGTWNENTGTSPCLAVKLFRKSLLQSHSKVNLSPPLNNRPYHSKSFKKRTPDAIGAAYQKVQYGASKYFIFYLVLDVLLFYAFEARRNVTTKLRGMTKTIELSQPGIT